MARPKPTILLEFTNQRTYKTDQVLLADGVYAVFYQGKPINIRMVNQLISSPGPKYKKSSFGSSGHAFNLADKLNKMFDTTDFAVYKLSNGELVTESVDD